MKSFKQYIKNGGNLEDLMSHANHSNRHGMDVEQHKGAKGGQ